MLKEVVCSLVVNFPSLGGEYSYSGNVVGLISEKCGWDLDWSSISNYL